MSDQVRMIVAVGLCVVAYFLPQIENMNIVPGISGPKVREVLNIPEPTSEYMALAKSQDDITNKKDRQELSIFTYEFSNRVPQYETTVQKLQDTYSYAAKELFGSRLNDATPKIGLLVGKEALSSIVGDVDGFIKSEEREELSKQFNAKAWVLGD